MLTLTTLLLTPAFAHGGNHGNHRGPHHGANHANPNRHAAHVEVVNRYAVPVHLVVDGAVVGRVRANERTTFRVDTGPHQLELRTLDGYRLKREHTFLSPREHERIAARPRQTQVTLTNRGSLPLFVQGPDVGLWIAPFGTTTASVQSGPLDLVASVQGRRGRLQTVDTVHLFAPPNQTTATTVGIAPRPTRPVAYAPPPYRPAYSYTGYPRRR